MPLSALPSCRRFCYTLLCCHDSTKQTTRPCGSFLRDSGKPRCADYWTDSDIAVYRTRLPLEFHSVPLDALRRQWVNIRKKGTEGYHVNGHGPKKGTFKLRHVPEEYREYLLSDSWKTRRRMWLEAWGYRCSVFNEGEPRTLDVHHRTYERLGNEAKTDCIVLCRQCHDLFHNGDADGDTLFS